MTDYPCEIDTETRDRIITSLQNGYDRFDAAAFELDADGNYPQLGEGKVQALLDWIYPATHLILSPRKGHEQADRDLGRKMMMRAIRQGRYLEEGDPADGVWYWRITDEKPAKPQDRNTPGFMGCGLVRAWASDTQKFSDWPEEDLAEFKAAIAASVAAGERHWVRLGYTNPQCLDLWLGFAAADLLDDEEMRAQTRWRLERFVKFAHYADSFEEWLSPTYAGVNLTGLVPLNWYLKGTDLEETMVALMRYQWQLIADGAHASTREVCMPHSRAYGDVASENANCLYGWLHLAAPDIFTFDSECVPEHFKGVADAWRTKLPFDGLAAPGLYVPLGLPDDVMAALRSRNETPVEKRFVMEWIGGCGWERRDDFPLDAIVRPNAPVPRFGMGTYYKTDRFCVGSVNESHTWVQRRPCGAYWNDTQGAATGLKLHVVFDGRDDMRWVFTESVVETILHQSGPTVLGALHSAPVAQAEPGDVLQAPAERIAIGKQGHANNEAPAAWLLGSHWREGISSDRLTSNVVRAWFGLTPIGRGSWESLDDEGLRWRFFENGIETVVELASPGRIEELPNLTRTDTPVPCLTIASVEDAEWNLLDMPDILWPFGMTVQGEGDPRVFGLQVSGMPHDFELSLAELRMTWKSAMRPDRVSDRTWRGYVSGEEVLPGSPAHR